MKTKFLTALLFFFVASLHAQTPKAFEPVEEDQIPKHVVENFNERYPDMENYQWRFFDGEYEIEFQNEMGFSEFHRLNAQGDLLSIRVKKDWSKHAPKKLVEGKKKTYYKYWQVTDYYECRKPKGEIFYLLFLKDETGDTKSIHFDSSGTVDSKSNSGF